MGAATLHATFIRMRCTASASQPAEATAAGQRWGAGAARGATGARQAAEDTAASQPAGRQAPAQHPQHAARPSEAHHGRTAGPAASCCGCAAPACRPGNPCAGRRRRPGRCRMRQAGSGWASAGGGRRAMGRRRAQAGARAAPTAARTAAACALFPHASAPTHSALTLTHLDRGNQRGDAPTKSGSRAMPVAYDASRAASPISVIRLGASHMGSQCSVMSAGRAQAPCGCVTARAGQRARGTSSGGDSCQALLTIPHGLVQLIQEGVAAGLVGVAAKPLQGPPARGAAAPGGASGPTAGGGGGGSGGGMCCSFPHRVASSDRCPHSQVCPHARGRADGRGCCLPLHLVRYGIAAGLCRPTSRAPGPMLLQMAIRDSRERLLGARRRHSKPPCSSMALASGRESPRRTPAISGNASCAPRRACHAAAARRPPLQRSACASLRRA